jgi:uncharacterized hydrophobic protein (TIGR00271 family)
LLLLRIKLPKFPSGFQKKISQSQQQLAQFWNRDRADWHWLAEKPVPIASLNRNLWRSSVPSFNFYILLALSGAISTLGLLAGSAATIIGAMIIAPLMGPMIGIAYAMVMANRRLLRRSSFTLLTGILMTIGTSMIISYLIGLRTLNSEITARVHPTLMDLGVALAAGAAGSFAKSRRGIADALPGVAIAVALVPPLSVIGIGLAFGEQTVTTGASLLFLTNLISIIFSGGLVFLCQRYGSIERARQGLIASILALSVLGLPLAFSLRNLLIKENVRRHVVMLINRQTVTFSDKDIRSVRVYPQGNGLFVELEVAAPWNSVSEQQVKLVRDFLEHKLEKPVNLNVQVIPISVFEAQASPLK